MQTRLLLAAYMVAMCLSACAQNPPAASPSALDVVIESLKHTNSDLDIRKNYTYQEREVEKHLDARGSVTKTEIHTYDIVMVGQKHHARLIAKDDKPLSEKEADKEEERMRKVEQKDEERMRKADPAKDKEKEEERERRIIKEFSEVYNFSFAGDDTIDGEPAWIIRAVPIASYQPRSVEARLLKCMQGRIWIAKNDYRWVRIEGEAISDFSYGLFLLKLHKGMHIYMEQARVNNEIWLPKIMRATNLDARIAWHTERVDSETTYSNYKKFRADAKVTGVAPAPPQ